MATAVLGVVVLLVLGMGGMLPASGNEPEGGDGITFDVDPSDDLPTSSIVTVPVRASSRRAPSRPR